MAENNRTTVVRITPSLHFSFIPPCVVCPPSRLFDYHTIACTNTIHSSLCPCSGVSTNQIMPKRRRSRSAGRLEYQRVVLDEMPVAARKRLRKVSNNIKRKPRRETTVKRKTPVVHCPKKCIIPKEVVLPATPLRAGRLPSPLTASPSLKFRG